MKNLLSMINQKILKLFNIVIAKSERTILFIPHRNCKSDGYDILNGESDNVLCLFNSIIRDSRFDTYQLFLVYYNPDRLRDYITYCEKFDISRITFIYSRDSIKFYLSFFKSKTIFTDNTFLKPYYKTNHQRLISLNYFAGIIKNEFNKWENNGGFKRMVREQKALYKLYDYQLSISDICSQLLALNDCFYYPKFLSLGFPRNDVFFRDNSELRHRIEHIVNFEVKHIITYSPTHRDYENMKRKFYDANKMSQRTIWGQVSESELYDFEKILDETGTLIIAKLHPEQEKSLVQLNTCSHIITYSKLSEKITTSLNPILSISDYLIADYTGTIYDYLYTGRPIIFYFYDYEDYLSTRGFFIDPIQPICVGPITYNIVDLGMAIKQLTNGDDPYQQKRQFFCELFIKYLDGNSTERIINYLF